MEKKKIVALIKPFMEQLTAPAVEYSIFRVEDGECIEDSSTDGKFEVHDDWFGVPGQGIAFKDVKSVRIDNDEEANRFTLEVVAGAFKYVFASGAGKLEQYGKPVPFEKAVDLLGDLKVILLDPGREEEVLWSYLDREQLMLEVGYSWLDCEKIQLAGSCFRMKDHILTVFEKGGSLSHSFAVYRVVDEEELC